MGSVHVRSVSEGRLSFLSSPASVPASVVRKNRYWVLGLRFGTMKVLAEVSTLMLALGKDLTGR